MGMTAIGSSLVANQKNQEAPEGNFNHHNISQPQQNAESHVPTPESALTQSTFSNSSPLENRSVETNDTSPAPTQAHGEFSTAGTHMQKTNETNAVTNTKSDINIADTIKSLNALSKAAKNGNVSDDNLIFKTLEKAIKNVKGTKLKTRGIFKKSYYIEYKNITISLQDHNFVVSSNKAGVDIRQESFDFFTELEKNQPETAAGNANESLITFGKSHGNGVQEIRIGDTHYIIPVPAENTPPISVTINKDGNLSFTNQEQAKHFQNQLNNFTNAFNKFYPGDEKYAEAGEALKTMQYQLNQSISTINQSHQEGDSFPISYATLSSMIKDVNYENIENLQKTEDILNEITIQLDQLNPEIQNEVFEKLKEIMTKIQSEKENIDSSLYLQKMRSNIITTSEEIGQKQVEKELQEIEQAISSLGDNPTDEQINTEVEQLNILKEHIDDYHTIWYQCSSAEGYRLDEASVKALTEKTSKDQKQLLDLIITLENTRPNTEISNLLKQEKPIGEEQVDKAKTDAKTKINSENSGGLGQRINQYIDGISSILRNRTDLPPQAKMLIESAFANQVQNMIAYKDRSFISQEYLDKTLENCISAYKDAVSKQDEKNIQNVTEVKSSICKNLDEEAAKIVESACDDQSQSLLRDATLTTEEKENIFKNFSENLISNLDVIKQASNNSVAINNYVNAVMLMAKNQVTTNTNSAYQDIISYCSAYNLEVQVECLKNLDEALTYFRTTSGNKNLVETFLANVNSLLTDRTSDSVDFNKILDQALVQTTCSGTQLPQGISANNIYEQLAQKWDKQNVDSNKQLPDSGKTLKDIGIGTVSAKVDLIQSVINEASSQPIDSVNIQDITSKCIENSNVEDVMKVRTYLIKKHNDAHVPLSIKGMLENTVGRKKIALCKDTVENLKNNPISHEKIVNYENQIKDFTERTKRNGWQYNEAGYWSRPLTLVINNQDLIKQLIENYAQKTKSSIEVNSNNELVITTINNIRTKSMDDATPEYCAIKYDPPIKINLSKVQVAPAPEQKTANSIAYTPASFQLQFINDQNKYDGTATITAPSGAHVKNNIKSSLDPRFIKIDSSFAPESTPLSNQGDNQNFDFNDPTVDIPDFFNNSQTFTLK